MYKITTQNDNLDHSATLTERTKRDAMRMARKVVRDLQRTHGIPMTRVDTFDEAAWIGEGALVTVRID